MGFKVWRNLSALAFAGVALIGCNNGSQKQPVPAPLPQQGSQMAPGGGTQFPVAQQPKPYTPPGASTQFGSSTSQTQFGPQSPPATSQFGPQPGQVSPTQFGPQSGAGGPSMMPGNPPTGMSNLPPLPSPSAPNTGGFTPGPTPSAPSIAPGVGSQLPPAGGGGFASQPGPAMPGSSPGMIPMIPPPTR